MNYDVFSKIVQAAKNVERLVFRGLVFNKTGKIDFGRDLNYTISCLSLYHTGHESYCNWKSNKSQFNTILKEIKESKMEKHLQTIDVGTCNLTVADVTLSGVDVVFENPSPLEV